MYRWSPLATGIAHPCRYRRPIPWRIAIRKRVQKLVGSLQSKLSFIMFLAPGALGPFCKVFRGIVSFTQRISARDIDTRVG